MIEKYRYKLKNADTNCNLYRFFTCETSFERSRRLNDYLQWAVVEKSRKGFFLKEIFFNHINPINKSSPRTARAQLLSLANIAYV